MSSAFAIASKKMSELIALANASYKTLVEIVNEVIGDGSPKGVFDTLSDLQAEYPTGAMGVFLVTANGNWYYWDDEWLSGGVYQATQLSDGSVTEEKLEASLRENIEQIPIISDKVDYQEERINNLVGQAGNSNTEIVDARQPIAGPAYPVLGARLNAIDEQLAETEQQIVGLDTVKADKAEVNELAAQKIDKGDVSVTDINKNNGKFDQTYFTEETIQQWAGTTPVNAIPANSSLVQKQYADTSVTQEKTDFLKVTSNNLYDKSTVMANTIIDTGTGEPVSNANNSLSKFITVLSNQSYTFTKVGRIAYYTNAYAFISSTLIDGSATTTAVIPPTARYVRLIINNINVATAQFNAGTSLLAYDDYKVELKNARSVETADIKARAVVSDKRTSVGAFPIVSCSAGALNFNFTSKMLEFPASGYVTLSIGSYYKLWTVALPSIDLTNSGVILDLGALYFNMTTETFYTSLLSTAVGANKATTENSVLVAVYYIQTKKVDMAGNYTVDGQSGNESGSDKIRYVSPVGSDANTGSSSSSPYLTFQKAINDGAGIIYALPGDYIGQRINVSDRDKLEIKVINAPYVQADKEKPKARLINASSLTLALDGTSGLYKADLTVTTDSNWHKVFITQTLPVVRSGLRSVSYNAILWETNNSSIVDDKKLLPVLDLATCQATAASFFFDGTAVYVNPTGGTISGKAFRKLINEEGRAINLSRINKVVIEDLCTLYSADIPFMLERCNDVTLQHCEVGYSAYGTGIRYDYTNANSYCCKSYKNCGDGFAPVWYGDTNFYNCEGFYNYDDGISHHDNCTGLIIAGEWHHNVKGGMAPAHGAKVDTHNNISHHNGYGMYAMADEGTNVGKTVRHVGNVYYNNTYGIGVKNYHVLSYNCKYVNNITPVQIVTTNPDTSFTEL